MQKNIVIKKLEKLESVQTVPTHVSFKLNYENILNPAQYEAVSSIEGSYLLIAGAGTGKTQTLVYRVARLIELGNDPTSILLLTFTRKAAQEMMSRASALLDARCSKIIGGTFHGFANITLRKYAKVIGLDPAFTILDQGDCEDIINLIKGELKLDNEKSRFPKKDTIYKLYNLSINTNKDISDVLAKEYPHFKEHIDSIKTIIHKFIEYKIKNNLLDYDDLLIYLNKFITSNDAIAESFLNSIKFIMVDEYQDTNYIQSILVKNLAKKNNNIMVVGDDSQSIYSFRGADVQNILNFPKLFPNTKIIKLEENYRSTQSILNFTNEIIKQSLYKFEKILYTKKLGGELPIIVSTKTENLQSRFIVNEILELREKGINLNDIAVLFRNAYFSFDLELELAKANIPFIKIGGIKFVETAHIKDVLAFLRISMNIKDFVSWYRVLLLHDGIGPKKAKSILNEINEKNYNFDYNPDILSKKLINDSLINLFYLLQNLYKKNLTPSEKIQLILNYYDPIFSIIYDDFNKRKKDLEILVAISQRYKSTETFLADMALDPPKDSIIDVEAEEKDRELLTLSTIHSAKGLEWHSVFIINVVQGLFPSSQAFENYDKLEEERRLMYVAATRAKQNLYITYPNLIFDRFAGYTIGKPSEFINTLSADFANNWIVSEE